MGHPNKIVFDSSTDSAVPQVYTYSTHVEVVPAHKNSFGNRVVDWDKEKKFDLADYDVQVIVTEKVKPFVPTWFGRVSTVTGKITSAYLADNKTDLEYYLARPLSYRKIEAVRELDK